MLYASIALFFLAATFGATILITWLNKKNAPKLVVYTHGLLAVSGLLALVAGNYLGAQLVLKYRLGTINED